MNLTQKERNNILRLLEQPHHVNCIRLHGSTSTLHRKRVAEICLQAIERKIDFVTESKFKGGLGRPDIVLLELGICVEVVRSESKESIEMKREKYPLRLVTSHIRTPFIWKQLL